MSGICIILKPGCFSAAIPLALGFPNKLFFYGNKIVHLLDRRKYLIQHFAVGNYLTVLLVARVRSLILLGREILVKFHLILLKRRTNLFARWW